MKIQYASDLHLEFADNWRYLKENPLQVKGDILVLAGDIGYLGDDNYTKHPFWDWASENYQQVIACMGNHEFYKFYDIAKLNDGYSLEIRPNVHSYYNAVVHIGDIDFIISTLWARIPLKEAYYTEQVSSMARRKIVVTHHVPSFQMQCPKFAESQANGAFMVELEDYIKVSGIDYWIYGHSHYNVEIEIGNTKCVSNQLGYVFHGEHELFDPGKFIEA